ncbi:hypothetical protein B0T26DRAFT_744402 [Lasiosphaeria miniovina]|uniref:DUF6594 domain-containing protein n=1 Tax=Lasiosphaeria miniovina TaxID=1954250 RepID=A0AA39ZU82_9PEZI|nr:uncharacterized protein B0T26DRAFT_744402 [Lasiosphaeria miniovina]KAK0703661.1 hypothetical protein B0T26DRAFT_744402 [Lasiosphaeria miniovina]
MKPLRSCLPHWTLSKPVPEDERQMMKTDHIQIQTPPPKSVEDYRLGYPRFTALISAHDPFLVCRQFKKLRARLLLLKQDKLSALEQRLEQIDRDETCPLFLGKGRSDGNQDRESILSEIELCLKDYDQFAERTNRMLGLAPANERDVESLQNWVDGMGCIARAETAYLSHGEELVCLAPAGDQALLQLETWVEDKLIQYYPRFRRSRFHNVSIDPHVIIYSGPWIKRMAKALLLFLITLLLLMPVVICNLIDTISIRLVVVMACTISYLLVLFALTRSRTMDLVLAGATYATVLIVFVSGTSGIQD